MADCEVIAGCLFFNDKLANMPVIAGWLKIQYCRGNSSDCARCRVRRALGGAKVPSDLFPNEQARSERLIAIAGNAGTESA